MTTLAGGRRPRSLDLMRFFRHFARNIDAVLLCAICVLHVYLAPFTKVEESFNVQAVYDLLYKSWRDPTTFDHATFPGVVPRTFLAPLLLYFIVAPLKWLLNLHPLAAFVTMRLALVLLSATALLCIRHALNKQHSRATGAMFTLLTACQFHLPFYAGRPLANVFAMLFTNLSLAQRISSTTPRTTLYSHALLALAVALLRSELSILLFWTIAIDALTTQVSVISSALVSLATAVIGASASIAIDSHFWRPRPGIPFGLRYPELEVFHFNAILGKSSAWGTLPFHYYFSCGIPRALCGAIPLALAALAMRDTRTHAARSLAPALLFVATYSLLPHKELRFVIYALPAATIAAAHSAAVLLRVARAAPPGKGRPTGTKSALRRVFAAGALLICVAASVAATLVSTVASNTNYPGAAALLVLRKQVGCPQRRVAVHVDAHAASTGVSQFVEKHVGCESWSISRDEGLDDEALRARFSYLVARRPHVQGFRVVHRQHKYKRIDYKRMRPMTAPNVFVHEREDVEIDRTATKAR